MRPPVTLLLDSASQYAALMWILLLLFLLRVVGQIVAATLAPAWLPPMPRWYSGLMPYRYLLPTQIVFLIVMTLMALQVGADGATLGTHGRSSLLGDAIVWGSYIYALGMVVRSVRYVRAPRERRGVLIPIIFHFVLAAFLFVYGSKLTVEQQRDLSPRRTPRDAKDTLGQPRALRLLITASGCFVRRCVLRPFPKKLVGFEADRGCPSRSFASFAVKDLAVAVVLGTESRRLDELRGRYEDRQRPCNTQRAIRVVVPLARRMRVPATAARPDRDRRHA